jgi:hypothetical protein
MLTVPTTPRSTYSDPPELGGWTSVCPGVSALLQNEPKCVKLVTVVGNTKAIRSHPDPRPASIDP